MCGIAGLWDFRRNNSAEENLQTANRMADSLYHRGPDDAGGWADETNGLAFGFRRLSILDPTPRGHQPMVSSSGRYVVVFNGEIYNNSTIRRILTDVTPGRSWASGTDTEALLASVEYWGVRGALERLDGMFAFGLWDTQNRQLTLARDKIGEKPLYFATVDGSLLFASESQAFRQHRAWRGEINKEALAAYIRFGYVPGKLSLYAEAQKLLPGHYLTIGSNEALEGAFASVPYWSLSQAAVNGLRSPITNDAELTDELDRLLSNAVRSRMIADVPLGAFLSGGLDSSTIVALMQANSSRPIKTFTIGFNDEALNEAPRASAFAKSIGTDHHEFYITDRDALDLIPSLPAICDEPLGDASIIPTHLVAKLASKTVKVALSGDGADEFFMGYERYFRTLRSWNVLRRFPPFARSIVSLSISSIPVEAWDAIGGFVPRHHRRAHFGDSLHKLSEIMNASTGTEYFVALTSHCRRPQDFVGRESEIDLLGLANTLPKNSSLTDAMMLIDQLSYLPDDILAKFDRATMAASLEGRAPFLDPCVVELAWRIPVDRRSLAGMGKLPLRNVLARYADMSQMPTKKRGFGVPLLQWLRGPLRGWAESLLSPTTIAEDGYLDANAVAHAWNSLLDGRRDWSQQIWNILMFQAWLKR